MRECKNYPSRGPEGKDIPTKSAVSGRSFSGMGDWKKLYGQQANWSGIDSGIFCP
jgi:hypothetical protein